MLYGVDVHPRYQAGIDFDQLGAQGYSFAAVKATQGNWLSIPAFADWVNRAKRAALVPGAYHWLDGRSSGRDQARFFYDYVRKSIGGPEGLLIQLDNEDTDVPATWQITQDWAAEWEQISGGHPWLMYTGKWWWGPRGWNGANLTRYLWDSHYLTADLDTVPDDPAAFAARIPSDWWTPGYGGWPVATFLQFTSRGDAGGLGNNVDLNATNLSREQMLALAGQRKDVEMKIFKMPSGALWASTGTGRRLILDPVGRAAEPCVRDAWGADAIKVVTPTMIARRTEEQWLDVAAGPVDVAAGPITLSGQLTGSLSGSLSGTLSGQVTGEFSGSSALGVQDGTGG